MSKYHFNKLLNIFKAQFPINKLSLKKNFHHRERLGLVIRYLSSKLSLNDLAQYFEIHSTFISRYINHDLPLLHSILTKAKESKILWPNENEMEVLSKIMQYKYPYLKGCFGFADGLNIKILNHEDTNIQNAYYNGWLGGTYCSQVICFNILGKIIHCAVNYPGNLINNDHN